MLIGAVTKTSNIRSLYSSIHFSKETSAVTEEVTTAKEEKEKNNEEENNYYSHKRYNIGSDMPEGTYIIECTATDFSMEILVFENEQNFNDFENADKLTGGEYSAAVEKYAWFDTYLYEEEKVYVNLESGNIILLDDGMCEFNKHNPLETGELISGVYTVGKDMKSGNIDVKCVSNFRVTVFDTKEKYIEYHQSTRFTGGEEDEAIEKTSSMSEYVYEDDIISLELTDGMIVMIEYGTGTYSIDEGPVIN